MNPNTKEIIEIPLGIEAHRLAKQFAAEQDNPEKRKQVYLNTLAVYAVHRYLHWLQIETDFTKSDSWNPLLRCRWNVADLWLPTIGKLECRPVLPEEKVIELPEKVRKDRIAYLGIQFSEQLDYVQILGFKAAVEEAVSPKIISVYELRSLDRFIPYLERIAKKGVSATINVASWLQDEVDKIAQELSWIVLPTLTLSANWLGASETLEEIIREIQQRWGIELPSETINACKDYWVAGHHLRLYAITGKFPVSGIEEWSLLLILTSGDENDLPQGTQLQISDQREVLAAPELFPGRSDAYLFTYVVGRLDEIFQVTLRIMNDSLTLKPFAFEDE
ncbi:DUF1822 family protein [Coleofasciculus chthonoplastes]|uniref:DUF1822 family protein n=1 Tax=Coleofasciculus chthonoplastes TaxID=64178 RepID=UPI0032FE6CC1